MAEKKLESNLFRIRELRDEMGQAVLNCIKLIEMQKDLVTVLENENKNKTVNTDFSQLISETKDQITGYQKQIDDIKTKTEYCDTIINYYDNGRKDGATDQEKLISEITDEVVTKLIEAFNMFRRSY